MKLDAEPDSAARRWIAGDPDPNTRAELQDLVDVAPRSAEARAELDERMNGFPRFGTAGLRAPVRAGSNGMNRAVVMRTTAGVAAWLTDNGFAGGTVVVGSDARIGSTRFAADTAEVLAAAGFEVRVLPEPLPTPVLAGTTRALGAVAGIQITASHNPPQDNGYKLYLAGGIQPVSPVDGEVEGRISSVPPATSIPRSEDWTTQGSALDDYLARVAELPGGSARELRIAVTALHGVGGEPLLRALRESGFTDVTAVEAQQHPDPAFPTVRYPNPEEPGAADLLLDLAEDIDADLAIALDPDADRCALGVRVGGVWRMLSGDETGVLLAEHVLSRLDRSANPDPLVATTLVSSTMLRSLAAEAGVRFAETFTGFKWLVRAGDGGAGLVYAYEEALGHCVDPEHVRDKDGISAAVLGCDLAASAKAAGRDLPGLLDDLHARHGVHRTGQLSVRVTEVDEIAATMHRLRDSPPAELAGFPVRVTDLLPDADALLVTGAGGLRTVIRPSGTEPKLKCYMQVVEPAEARSLRVAEERAEQRLAELRRAVSELVGGPRCPDC